MTGCIAWPLILWTFFCTRWLVFLDVRTLILWTFLVMILWTSFSTSEHFFAEKMAPPGLDRPSISTLDQTTRLLFGDGDGAPSIGTSMSTHSDISRYVCSMLNALVSYLWTESCSVTLLVSDEDAAQNWELLVVIQTRHGHMNVGLLFATVLSFWSNVGLVGLCILYFALCAQGTLMLSLRLSCMLF
jgi:hypothetical protein